MESKHPNTACCWLLFFPNTQRHHTADTADNWKWNYKYKKKKKRTHSFILSYSTLWTRNPFNAATLQRFLGQFPLIFATHRTAVTNKKPHRKPITCRRRGRKHTPGAAARLDGWQNETTERKQIAQCQPGRHKNTQRDARWCRLTQLRLPSQAQLLPSPVLLTAARQSDETSEPVTGEGEHICLRGTTIKLHFFNSLSDWMCWKGGRTCLQLQSCPS